MVPDPLFQAGRLEKHGDVRGCVAGRQLRASRELLFAFPRERWRALSPTLGHHF